MTALEYFPPSEADLDAARAIVRGESSLRHEIVLACNVLCQSRDADDRMTASEVRNVLWSDYASELRPEARALANRLNSRDDQEVIDAAAPYLGFAGGMVAGVILAMLVVRAWLGAV